MAEVIHPDKLAKQRDDLRKVLTQEHQRSTSEQLKILDTLRRTRAARGGVGAPLQIPAHLRDSQQIVVTDADLDTNNQQLPAALLKPGEESE